MKNVMDFRLLLLGLPLALGACSSSFTPHPMPSGYTYHSQPYKAPTGPEPVLEKWERTLHGGYPEEPPRIPVETSTSATPEAAPQIPARLHIYEQETARQPLAAAPATQGAWTGAATDLIARINSQFGVPVDSVFIRPAHPLSAEERHLQQALSQAAQAAGWNIARDAGSGPFVLDYTVRPLTGPEMMISVALRLPEDPDIHASGAYAVMAAPAWHGASPAPAPMHPYMPGHQSARPTGAPQNITR